jgi:hypothetical protein
MMKFAYTRAGGPLMSWGSTAPRQAKAAPGSLGSLENTTLLPAPGAPEPIGVTRGAMGGCGCSGSCGCGGSHGAVGDFVDSIPGGYVTLAVAAVVAWKLFKKR